MIKPQQYELCKWINEHYISGLEIEYDYSDLDNCKTYWILKEIDGKKKKVLNTTIRHLVDLNPGYNSVLHLNNKIRLDVENYTQFVEANAKELAEYKRLKAKFGD